MAPYVQPPCGGAGYVSTADRCRTNVQNLASSKGQLDKAHGSAAYSGVMELFLTNYSSIFLPKNIDVQHSIDMCY